MHRCLVPYLRQECPISHKSFAVYVYSSLRLTAQVDAIVYSVNPHGFFAQAGPLRLFVSAHVCSLAIIACLEVR